MTKVKQLQIYLLLQEIVEIIFNLLSELVALGFEYLIVVYLVCHLVVY